jgi:hypothetical protein
MQNEIEGKMDTEAVVEKRKERLKYSSRAENKGRLGQRMYIHEVLYKKKRTARARDEMKPTSKPALR